jgi:hypothetical protein
LYAAISNPGRGPGSSIIWLNLVPGVSGVVLGILKVAGGKAMRDMKHRPLAILGSIAACIPLSMGACIIWLLFPAYIVGLVFGILAMTQLFRKECRIAFEVNRPDGDPDSIQ